MALTKPRPFLDTNVIFSGLHSPNGPPAAILRLHASGRLAAVVSQQVLDELVRAISNKQPRLIPTLHAFLAETPPEVCPDPSPHVVARLRPLINAADAPILAVAIESGADCLVTGNTRHFTAEVSEGDDIAILTPTNYLQTLTPE